MAGTLNDALPEAFEADNETPAVTEVPMDAGDGEDDADREVVEQERAKLRGFIKGLDPNDIKSGGWFTKLTAHALSS